MNPPIRLYGKTGKLLTYNYKSNNSLSCKLLYNPLSRTEAAYNIASKKESQDYYTGTLTSRAEYRDRGNCINVSCHPLHKRSYTICIIKKYA